MSVKFERDYLVSDGAVFLSVSIGDKQIGTSVVTLSGAILRMGDIKDLKIGEGPALDGKVCSVKTVVTDVNDSTNMTSVTYHLVGGKKDEQFVLESEVKKDGDSIIYRTKITFVS